MSALSTWALGQHFHGFSSKIGLSEGSSYHSFFRYWGDETKWSSSKTTFNCSIFNLLFPEYPSLSLRLSSLTIFLIICLDIPSPYILYLVMSFKYNTGRVDNRYCCFFFVFWRNEFVVVASMPHLGAALFIILAQNLWWIVYIVLGKWFSWKIDLLCKQSGLLLSAATNSWSHSKLKLPMCRE